MAIEKEEWESIGGLVQTVMRKKGGFVAQGVVVGVDEDRRVIFLAGFGRQPIPVFGFKHKLQYYDTEPSGEVKVRYAELEPLLPKVGETVLIVKQQGSRRLPKCVGVLQSTGFVNLEPQEN